MPLPTLADIAACETQLVEEYKILQVKLDKIGEFKFHVKNWAFTLTVGIIAGGLTAKIPVGAVFLSSTIPSVVFWALEKRQEQLGDIFSKRVRLLETTARRNAALRRRALIGTPVTPPDIQTLKIAGAISSGLPKGKWWKNPDNLFYVFLLLLAGIAACGASVRDSNSPINVEGHISIDPPSIHSKEGTPPSVLQPSDVHTGQPLYTPYRPPSDTEPFRDHIPFRLGPTTPNAAP